MASLDEVFWLTWVLWSISSSSSSLMPSLIHLATALNSSQSMTPSSLVSQRAKMRLRPSLVLKSPTLVPTTSRNSSKLMGLFLSLSAWMRERMKGFLLSIPSSSRALLISAGSMVPLLSSSKTWNVSLSSLQSSSERRSFQLVALVAGAGAGAFTWDLLIGSHSNNKNQYKRSLPSQLNPIIHPYYNKSILLLKGAFWCSGLRGLNLLAFALLQPFQESVTQPSRRYQQQQVTVICIVVCLDLEIIWGHRS